MTKTFTASELQRFELDLFEDGTDEKIETFTWGPTYRQAYARVIDTMEDATWNGWSFKLYAFGRNTA